MYHRVNGIKADLTQQQVINGVVWPAGELLLARNKQQWGALGITEVPDEILPDPLQFKWTTNPDGTLNITALTAVEKNAALRIPAQIALQKTDTVVLRCYSASVPVPAEWQAYRVALRALAAGTDTTSTTLPAQPLTYPVGT